MFEILEKKVLRKTELSELMEYRNSLADELASDNSEHSVEELKLAVDDCLAEIDNRTQISKLRSAKMESLQSRSFDKIASYQTEVEADEYEDDPYATKEYRIAFRNYILFRKVSDVLLRENQNTKTTDIAAVVPSPVENRIVEKIKSYGMIYNLVNHTSFPVGQTIPTSSVKPTASWVAEGAGSYRQKKTTSSIVFTHNKLRCEISMSQEAHVMSLSAFEAAFIDNVAEAMMVAIETSIVSGDGSGEPKGILAETPVSGQALEVAYNTDLDYELLLDAEAALPQAYENGAVWCMTKKTFYKFMGIVDDNGQPIARINFGISGRPEYMLNGRTVVICGDYMSNFTKTPSADTIFAFMFRFKDYTLNNNYNMGISQKQDWDTEDWLWKAVAAYDGKVVDKNSLVTLTVKDNS